MSMTERSDGSTASYYELPPGATQLQDLISHRDMNAQIGEIFRACYRMGLVEHSDELRDAKKILFYAKAEVERLEKLNRPKEEKSPTGAVQVTEKSCDTCKYVRGAFCDRLEEPTGIECWKNGHKGWG